MQNNESIHQIYFKGYWREVNKAGLPTFTGVYAVYRCRYDKTTDKVKLIEIIYIGQADDIRKRHANHDKLTSFKSLLQPGEELCYSCAEVDSRSLDMVENALIFAQKPRLNTELVNSYSHNSVHIKVDGCCACMKYTDFSISK